MGPQSIKTSLVVHVASMNTVDEICDLAILYSVTKILIVTLDQTNGQFSNNAIQFGLD